MATLKVDSIDISQADLATIATNVTDVTVRIAYDQTAPAGWSIVASGPLGSKVICPKPCGAVH